MELVESNAGIWAVLLLALCLALGFVVYDRLAASPWSATSSGLRGVEQSVRPPAKTLGSRAEVVRLEDLAAYEEIIERPLFRRTRRPPEPTPEVDEAEAEEATDEEEREALKELFALIGVVTAPDKRVAILKDLREGKVRRLLHGQRAGDWAVEEIGLDRVSLRSGEIVEELELVRGPLPEVKTGARRTPRRIRPRDLRDRRPAVPSSKAARG